MKESKFYLVGGFIRDELLGVKSKDLDFSVESSSYDSMKQAIIERGCDIKVEKPEYATIRAVDPKLGGVDFVLCRKDGYYSDGRRPDSIEAGSLFDDLARRDFTVNALAREEGKSEIIDYFGGLEDLKLKIIKTVGKPEERFKEDSIRILRALRFAIVKNFVLDFDIVDALNDREIVDGLKNVSVERVREELYKMFKHDTWRTLTLFSHFKLLSEATKDYFPKLWLNPTLEER